MTDRDLLALMIERSGLSARAFARDVLWRDERTVRRWLAGESPVPAVVADRLREELAKADAERQGIMRLGASGDDHRVGDAACDEGRCDGGAQYPKRCACGGFMHASFGDESRDGYWYHTRCDVCGDSE